MSAAVIGAVQIRSAKEFFGDCSPEFRFGLLHRPPAAETMERNYFKIGINLESRIHEIMQVSENSEFWIFARAQHSAIARDTLVVIAKKHGFKAAMNSLPDGKVWRLHKS